MSQLVIAAAGAAVGFIIGGPTGAQIGWFLGSALAPKPKQVVSQDPISDLKVTGTEYGQPIPWVQGHPRVAGQLWWASAKRAIPHYTESGGKGPGGETISLHYTYEADLLYGLTSNEIVGVSRIWSNGKLIYTALSSADPASIIASANTDAWTRMTVYTGASDQLPDPTYEAAVGATNAPSYRGRGTVFIQGLQLGVSGAIPNLTFEVATKATTGELVISTRLYHLNSSLLDAVSGAKTLTLHSAGAFNTSIKKFGAASAGEASAGSDYYYDTPDSGSGDFDFGSDDFTIDIQVYLNQLPDGSTNNQYAAVFGSVAYTGGPGDINMTANGQYGLLITGAGFGADSGKLLWQHRKTTGDYRQVFDFDSDPLTVGEWHHIAVIRVSNTIYLTVDGNLHAASATLDATDVITGGSSFALGGHSTSPPGFYPVSGYLDELRIVNGLAAWTEFPFTPPSVEYTGSDMSGTTITLQDEDLQDVVERLSLRTGLTAGQIDAGDLASITRNVRALAVSQITPTRQVLEMLGGTFFFEATVSDKVYFVPRGSAAAATIDYDDLGAADDEPDSDVEPLALRLNNEIEVPAQIALTYSNVNADYQTDTQYSDRLITAVDQSVSEVRIPMGFTQGEAKQIADAMLLDRAASAFSTKAALLGHYTRLEPTDPVLAEDRHSNQYRIRFVKKTDSYPKLEYEAVLDDVSVLSQLGITSADYTSQTTVDAAAATLMELMDIPILRDVDDDPGIYVAAKGETTPWPGAVILKSMDDLDFEEAENVLESAIFGETTTALGDWIGSRVFDESNSVTVNVGAGTLSSSTRAAIIDSRSVNAMLIGSEVLQFRTATLVSSGVYTLTGLLRGCRGTEWAMTGHDIGERCVLLRTRGIRRVPMETYELGIEKFWRAVTLGRRLSSAESEEFTNNGIGLKPFSPFDLRAARDGSNNITFTMQRRTRLAVRMIGPLGISVPLGEDSADFELDVMGDDSPGETVLRTISHSSMSDTLVTFEYTAAQQTSDGLTPGDPVTARGYQLSETVGRGYVHEGTV